MSLFDSPFTVCFRKSESGAEQTPGDIYRSTMLLLGPNIPHATILYGMFMKPRKQRRGYRQPSVSWGNFGDLMILQWSVPI